MSGFKRNSSRFSKGGSTESSSRDSGSSRASSSRGGYEGSNGASAKPRNFTRLGSLTVPKSVDEGLKDMILGELRGSDIKLNCQIYLPKGAQSVTLKTGDRLLITFQTNEKDKDFVVGHVLLPNNQE